MRIFQTPKMLYKILIVGQQSFNNKKVHLMAVLADRPLTVDVSVAVYKIFHKAFITLFANY